MNKLISHFSFDKRQRNGIFFLLLFILLIQFAYYSIRSFHSSSLQADIVEPELTMLGKEDGTYDFNPNFIDDHRGYMLGMSPDEIDRLLEFRKQGNYVNSAEEFQKISRISDSLFRVISPRFRFPVLSKRNTGSDKSSRYKPVHVNTVLEDINKATAEELMQINGIGKVLSERIIKYRGLLGGFVKNEQLSEVYGLTPQVVDLVLQKYSVISVPVIIKVGLNSTGVKELSRIPYINRQLALEIISQRTEVGKFNSIEDLCKIDNFPKEKLGIIELYLSLE